MAELMMNHYEKGFFGGMKQLRQDSTGNPGFYDLERCMKRVDKNQYETFHLVTNNGFGLTYFYDTGSEYENGIVSVRKYFLGKTNEVEKIPKRLAHTFFRNVLLNNIGE